MSVTKYFVNGQAYDYEDLEHFGYTTFPTNPTNFLSCEIGANFGTYDATQGYAYIDQVGSEIDGYEYNATYFYPVQPDGWGYWYDINLLATLGAAPETSLMVWLLDSTNTPIKSLSVTTNGEGSTRYFIANELVLDSNNDTVYWFAEAAFYDYGFSYPQCYVQLTEVPLDDPDVAVDYLETITGMSHESANSAIYGYVNSGYTTGIGGLKNSLDASLFAKLWNENNPSAEVGGFAEVVVANLTVDGDYGVMTTDGDEDLEFVPWGEEIPDHQGLYGCGMQDGETPLYGEIEMAVEAVAYLRASAYQHLNKSVTANSSNVLYESGADAGLSVDETKTYTLLGAYTNGDVSVDITGASLTLLASGGLYYLRLVWGPNAASVCYIKYSIS